MLKSSHDLARSLRLRSHSNNVILRGIKTSHSICSTTSSTSIASTQPPLTKRATTRTSKSFSELPKTWTNADGTAAIPLSPWIGGLENSLEVSPKENVVSPTDDSANNIPSPSLTDSAAEIAEPELIKPKRTRKKRAAAPAQGLVHTDGLNQTLQDEGPSKPKRARKKRANGDGSAQGEAVENVDSELKPRKVKRKAKKQQDSLASECLPEEETVVRQPTSPLATEILDNLVKFPHCILLTRVGQFYESYFEQAVEVARLLNIKLTSKSWGGQRVHMCGFPLIHLNKHLRTLVQGHNRFVALCEEFMRSRTLGPKGGFDRRVTRIVTPGTLIDEPFLNQYENNYLLSVTYPGDLAQPTGDSHALSHKPLGLAWIDVSTGEFFTKNIAYEGLRDELVRIGPKEVVLDNAIAEDTTHPIRKAITEENCFCSYMSTCSAEERDEIIEGQSGSDDLSLQLEPSKALQNLTDAEVAAVKLLTAFLHANLLEYMPRLSSPHREATAGRMQIDAHTIKALEIRESMREGGTTGSLFSVVKRTVTSGGTRLLARWLSSPSTSVIEINSRQSLVAYFYSRPHLRSDLVRSLSDVEDATRIVQKFLVGRGDASDLSAVCSTIDVWSSIKKRIEMERKMEEEENGHIVEGDWASIDALMSRLNSLGDLATTIKAAVGPRNGLLEANTIDVGPDEKSASTEHQFASSLFSDTTTSFNWTVRPEFSEELLRLHTELTDCLSCRNELERRWQLSYDAPSLTLRSSPGQGMHVHIARAKRDLVKIRQERRFIPITESNTTSTFFHQEWSQLGARIVEITNSIYSVEREAFDTLRQEVSSHESDIRLNSRILDELDATLAFANLAQEMNLTRPKLKENTSYNAVNGRHPTVELSLLTAGRLFTPNTVSFTPDSSLHIVTGPNMAGKSTLLRQTALIAILAQTGSFVPADSAEIGIIDRIFSRVGAKDDLFRDRSTFMVEMLETAEILRRATPNSLVIMDEVGRGTTMDDGLAIAFATVHHLHRVNRCRTLFATHFHELADMLGCSEEQKGQGTFRGVSFFCTDVDETEEGYFTYSHRLRPGVNRNSHGIKVAQLAGMPESAIGVAKSALHWFKNQRNGMLVKDKAALQLAGQSLASR